MARSESGSAEEMLEFAMRFEEAGGAELVFPIDSFSVSFGASNATPADPVGDGPSGCRLSVSRVADGRSLRLLKICADQARLPRLVLTGTLASELGSPAVYRLDLHGVQIAQYEHAAVSGEVHVMEQVTVVAARADMVQPAFIGTDKTGSGSPH